MSHYRFCLENAVIKNNTSCVFPTQYTNKINKDGAINQNILSHNIIFDELLNYKKKDHKFIDFKNSLKKTIFNKIKKKYDLRNKNFVFFILEMKKFIKQGIITLKIITNQSTTC